MKKAPSSRISILPLPLLIGCALTSGLGACSTVGITSIDHGRTPYNDVIQETSQQQALLNIIRVSNHEPPLFMDVGEVDQAHVASGSLSGGPAAIGAIANLRSTSAGTLSGTTGFVTGTTGYSEAPTVRYVPLAGQALIAQVSTPITPESLANLINSDWPMISVLALGTDRITPAYSAYDAALNAISELDKYGAIIVTATPKPQRAPTLTFDKIEISASQPEGKDNLTIYFMPENTAISPSACDRGNDLPLDSVRRIESRKIIYVLWRRLLNIYYAPNGPGAKPGAMLPGDLPDDKLPAYITIPSKGTLGTLPDPKNKHAVAEAPKAPILVTRSALGILKNAAEQDGTPAIQIFRDDQVRKYVSSYAADRASKCDDDFYEIPAGEDARATPDIQGLAPTKEDGHRDTDIAALISDTRRTSISSDFYNSSVDFNFLQKEKALAQQRRFMLIAQSDTLPTDAFVAVRHRGQWYYIIDGDDISKRTLALISQFNTIQAVPTQTPTLTPTIAVGAR